MNENEQDLQWQRPRSHSLPNLIYQDKRDDDWVDEDSDYGEEKEKKEKKNFNYMFKMERDFQYEINEYITLRHEIRRRKTRLLNGETDADAALSPEDQELKKLDERAQELSKK